MVLEAPVRPGLFERLRQPEWFTSGPSVLTVAREYQTQPHTPEFITQTFQHLWQARGEVVNMVFDVTPCPYTQKELVALEQEGRRVGYLPPELASGEGRYALGRIFPWMGQRKTKDAPGWKRVYVTVANDKNLSGWFNYDAGTKSPYLNTNEKQLIDEIAKDARELLSINQYMVAGADSKLFTGHYPDELWTPEAHHQGSPIENGTNVRLGSRVEGVAGLIVAYFQPDGLLVWHSYNADSHNSNLGGRSSRAKKAA